MVGRLAKALTGKQNSSKAGLTKVMYCVSTCSRSLPRSLMSLSTEKKKVQKIAHIRNIKLTLKTKEATLVKRYIDCVCVLKGLLLIQSLQVPQENHQATPTNLGATVLCLGPCLQTVSSERGLWSPGSRTLGCPQTGPHQLGTLSQTPLSCNTKGNCLFSVYLVAGIQSVCHVAMLVVSTITNEIQGQEQFQYLNLYLRCMGLIRITLANQEQ